MKGSYSWLGLSIDGSRCVGDNWGGSVDDGGRSVNGRWWGWRHVGGSFSCGGSWGGRGCGGRWRSWHVVVGKVSGSVAVSTVTISVAVAISVTVSISVSTVSGTVSGSGTVARSRSKSGSWTSYGSASLQKTCSSSESDVGAAEDDDVGRRLVDAVKDGEGGGGILGGNQGTQKGDDQSGGCLLG